MANEGILPKEVSLSQNYPNPFNMETTIIAAIPAGKLGRLAIYDIGGRIGARIQLPKVPVMSPDLPGTGVISMDNMPRAVYIYIV